MGMKHVLFVGAVLILSSCNGAGELNEQDVYILYRNSPIDDSMRLHVATFNSSEGYDDAEYNRENCQHAAQLFIEQPPMVGGKGLIWWCERGRFRE